jgi:lipopolysaccharide/colanic/teichoic acid biosynthesis glycosyltransferase
VTRSAWLDSPLKRATDVVVATIGLVVAAPILVIVAIAVRVRLGTPVLFRQQRAGRAGRPIEIVKFRSMTDARGSDGDLLDDEARLPAFGRRLRASSLDELPQLFTVLRGDMSLIGPRPLPVAYVDRYDEHQRRRLDATPGITGWAQVHGRNDIDWPTKLDLDVWYVEHASPRVDLTIIGRTLRSVVSRSGVAAADHATMPEFLGTPGLGPNGGDR